MVAYEYRRDAKMRGSYSKGYDMLESVLGSPVYANLPYM